MRPFMKHLRSTILGLALSSAVDASAAKDSGMSSLLSWSQELRTLERRLAGEQQQYNEAADAAYAYDLSSFSIRYDRCQYVKTYDDELAADQYSSSPLALKHFVLFRLCPTNSCSTTCASSGEAYGRYMTDVDTYLQYTVEQQKDIFENYCANCEEVDCEDCDSECKRDCYFYNNLEGSGYVDAANYIQCQELVDNDARRKLASRRKLEEEAEEEIEQEKFYIGPRCYGGGIKIGLFSDANCFEPLEDADVSDILGLEVSYYFLEHTFTSTTTKHNALCLTCDETEENANNKDKKDADKVNEMCERLYNAAAKCETPNGMTTGFIQTKRKNGNYENQVENEFLSCSFINSILWNSYSEKGEIDHVSRQDVYVRHVTELQSIGLSLIAVSFVSMVGLVFYMQNKIKSVTGGVKNVKVDGRGIFA